MNPEGGDIPFENEEELNQEELSFDKKKTKFFSILASKALSAFREHSDYGLMKKEEDGSSWRNVSQHCLVEGARSIEIGQLIGLSSETIRKLFLAAVLHDFYKKVEVLGNKERNDKPGYKELKESAEDSLRILKDHNWDDEIVYIVSSIGSMDEVEQILKNGPVDEKELAFLILQYIDSYTVSSDWVEPKKDVEGRIVNQVDCRVDYNENNPFNAKMKEDSRTILHLDGESIFEAQRRQGHQIEELITGKIYDQTGDNIDPLDIPWIVDNNIKERINNIEE